MKNALFSNYVGCCVQMNGNTVRNMVDQAITITPKTFRLRVGKESYQNLERELGYNDLRNLNLANDFSVSFHRSKYKGKTCYYCRWSGIECVFVK